MCGAFLRPAMYGNRTNLGVSVIRKVCLHCDSEGFALTAVLALSGTCFENYRKAKRCHGEGWCLVYFPRDTINLFEVERYSTRWRAESQDEWGDDEYIRVSDEAPRYDLVVKFVIDGIKNLRI